jgi:membrane associated rhomboid family serine protease
MDASSLSRKILIAILVLFLVSFFDPIAAWITGTTILLPTFVIPGLEVWRLVTYPFALAGMKLGLLVASICFGAPADEVESMIGTKRFGILLLAVVLGVSILHMLVYYGTMVPLAGPINLGLFVLVGFVYLFPHSEVRIIFFSVRSWVLLTFVVAIVIFTNVIDFVRGGTLAGLLFDGGFGAIISVVYFHLRYQKYRVLLRPIQSVERMMQGRKEQAEWRATPAARGAAAPQPVRLRMPFQKGPQREVTDEERLNNILDRINEKGYGDLSDDEKAFLRDYSDRI